MFAVGIGKGNAVAQSYGIGQDFGVWPALDELLQHVEGADVACLDELERVAAVDDAVALVGQGKGVEVEEVPVGIDGMAGMGFGHGHAAYSAQVVVEECAAVAVASPAVELFLFGGGEDCAHPYKVSVCSVDVAGRECGVAIKPVGSVVAFEIVGVAAESAFQFGLHFFVAPPLHVVLVGVFCFRHSLRLQCAT